MGGYCNASGPLLAVLDLPVDRARLKPPLGRAGGIPLSPVQRALSVPSRSHPALTPGDVGFPIRFGGVSYTIRILLYLDISSYLAVYLDVSRSYTSRYTKIHQDTSRYIKIHQDTFVSISLAIMEMYLTLGYLRYI